MCYLKMLILNWRIKTIFLFALSGLFFLLNSCAPREPIVTKPPSTTPPPAAAKEVEIITSIEKHGAPINCVCKDRNPQIYGRIEHSKQGDSWGCLKVPIYNQTHCDQFSEDAWTKYSENQGWEWDQDKQYWTTKDGGLDLDRHVNNFPVNGTEWCIDTYSYYHNTSDNKTVVADVFRICDCRHKFC